MRDVLMMMIYRISSISLIYANLCHFEMNTHACAEMGSCLCVY